MKALTFLKDISPKPTLQKLLDAKTTLNHYCQVNFTTPADRLKYILHPRFEPTTINLPDSNEPQAIISAVVFQEKDFHFPKMPFAGNFTFSQTNYRCYVIDKETGLRTVWFFGTTLDHWSIFVPRDVWSFPWHRARISFETELKQNEQSKHYQKYNMTAKSDWGAAEINVQDLQRKAEDSDFPGFPNKETALVYLTHPMSGHFYLNTYKPRLGCWEIWHEQMNPNIGVFDDTQDNYFKMFEDAGLITRDQKPYNILIQPEIDYNIYLPPLESISKNSRYTPNS